MTRAHIPTAVAALAALATVSMAGALGCPSQVAAACQGEACAPPPDEVAPRFFADPPFGVGFDCVTIGCDTVKPLVIENRGGGTLGIALVRPAIDSSGDFRVTGADGETLPTGDDEAATHVLLGAGERLALSVRYTPSDGALDQGSVEVEHYDASVFYLEAAPESEQLPLTARALGSAVASLPSALLDFGFVPIGSSATLEIVVDNSGSESVLTVGPVDREPGTSPVFHPPTPRAWGERLANSGEGVRVPVVFTPSSPTAFFGALVLATNDPLQPTVRIDVQGTAIPTARLAVVDPTGELVLAPVRAGETRTGTVTVRNLGGAPLDVVASIVTGAALGLSVSPPEVAGLAPLATATLEVALTSASGGPVAGSLLLASEGLDIEVPIVGAVDAPLLSSAPIALDLGDVVQGWSAEPQQVAIANTGFGELTITAIAFEVGSSSQIQVIDVPPLPVKLSPGDPAVLLTVLLTAGSIGPAEAVLLVSSDSVDSAVRRVDIHGDVITCEEGCPTPNGTPSCASGFCEVGTCIADFHDADTVVANGCECGEDIIGNAREDIAAACGGLNLGVLSDNDSGFNRQGTLHSATDVDLYFIEMRDDTQFLNDDYGGEIVLVSGPPGLQVCANFQDNGAGCGGAPTNCSTSRVRGNGQSGIFGGSDNSEDVTVFVSWQPGAAPQCGTYTVRFDADEDF